MNNTIFPNNNLSLILISTLLLSACYDSNWEQTETFSLYKLSEKCESIEEYSKVEHVGNNVKIEVVKKITKGTSLFPMINKNIDKKNLLITYTNYSPTEIVALCRYTVKIEHDIYGVPPEFKVDIKFKTKWSK